ncbi:hypothetical protein DID88_002626 [Monilinia fructigena]|uniref:Uncharacterized protein n=1 Tax=Monilinia fructigena TaxID=38457 RepID=A0A395IPD5_9HELO|nr:hypothetical protein DID88_002626 [Monilinia fructigena]
MSKSGGQGAVGMAISRPTQVVQWPLIGMNTGSESQQYQPPPNRGPPPQRPPRPSHVPSLLDSSRIQDITPTFQYQPQQPRQPPQPQNAFPLPQAQVSEGMGLSPRTLPGSHSSYASSAAIPSSWGPESQAIIDRMRTMMNYDAVSEGRESRGSDDNDDRGLIRSASIGKRARPSMITTRSSGQLDPAQINATPVQLDNHRLGPTPLQQSSSLSPVEAQASGTGLIDPTHLVLTNQTNYCHGNDDRFAFTKWNKKPGANAMLGAYQAASALPSDTVRAKSPLRTREDLLVDYQQSVDHRVLNIDAVRDAEARGSLTSLPDLIRRATRQDSTLSGMLSAFPTPGRETPARDTPRPASAWPEYDPNDPKSITTGKKQRNTAATATPEQECAADPSTTCKNGGTSYIDNGWRIYWVTTTSSGSATNITIGDSIPRLISAAQTNFSVPLFENTILARFNAGNLSCASENSLVTFDGNDERIGDANAEATPTKASKIKKDAHSDSTKVKLRAIAGPDSTYTNIISDDSSTLNRLPLTHNIKLLRKFPPPVFTITEEVLDFARVTVLFVLQQENLDNAVTAQGQLQKFFNQQSFENLAAMNVSWEVNSVNLVEFKLDLGNGTVGQKNTVT